MGLDDKESAVAVRIKKEKIDAEIEAKLRSAAIQAAIVKQEHSNEASRTCDEPSSGDADVDEQDDKKSIPVKSSKVFLAELFKLFNAAPPEELLDDDNLLKKKGSAAHKHHKRNKRDKKKKKSKNEKKEAEWVKSEGEVSITPEEGELDDARHKHRKKKVHKRHKTDECSNGHRQHKRGKSPSEERVRSKRHSKERGKNRDKVRDKGRQRQQSREKDLQLSDQRGRRTNCLATTTVEIKKDPSEDRLREERKRRHVHDLDDQNEPSAKRKATTTTTLHKIQIKLSTQQLPSQREHRSNGRGEGQISDISLSDEETYLKERERLGDTNERRRRPSEESRRCDRNGNYRKDASNSRRRRTGSRSRSRSQSLGIDKKRLLEIARKNAISMFKRGSLPGSAQMTEEIKDKVLLKMRYGGRTVQDLTDFCKKISNGEQLSGLSSDEDSDIDKGGNTKAFHHPFQLREREPIVMHIRNAKPMPLMQPQIKSTEAITMQFPVSSGQQHRLTEAPWVPVVENAAKAQLQPLPALPAAKQSTTMFKVAAAACTTAAPGLLGAQRNIFGGQMPQAQEQQPAFKPLSVAASTTVLESEMMTPFVSGSAPSAPVPPPILLSPLLPPPLLPPKPTKAPVMSFVPDTAVPSTISAPPCDNIFTAQASQMAANNVDVSAIISKRLNAMRRLQENPLDPEALKLMHTCQRDMSSWASSKHLPGQFTGSTGVNVLKAHELNSGPQQWARRDQLTTAQPVSGGLGMQLLQKMGWKPGEGLGREGNGSLTPLMLDVKLDKRGLVSKEDHRRSQPPPASPRQRPNACPNIGGGNLSNCIGGGVGAAIGGNVCAPLPLMNAAQVQRTMQEKHPVCLLNELTSKRKWTPPLYQLVNELGPSHSKMFLFSVSMNGQTFTPPRSCNTKKAAKFVAAQYCLQQIGILP